MAKKNDNSKYALLALLFGVGGYFIYNKWKKGKDGDTPTEGASEEDIILKIEQAKQANSTKSFSNYEIKVMYLQGWLNVAIDGIVGNQTLTALDYYWANYGKVLNAGTAKSANYPELRSSRGYGLLSEANIDNYTKLLVQGNAPRQLYWKNKAAAKPTTYSWWTK
jgi:lysozyme family protein